MTFSLDTSSLRAAVVDLGPKGKSATIASHGAPAKWLIPPLVVAFPPKGFVEESQRVSLCLSATPDVSAQLKALDAWALQWAAENQQACFGKTMSAELLQDKHVPCHKEHERFEPLLRAKISPKSICWWDSERQRREPPLDWRGCTCQAEIMAKDVWILSGQFCLSLEIQDAMLTDAPNACPF